MNNFWKFLCHQIGFEWLYMHLDTFVLDPNASMRYQPCRTQRKPIFRLALLAICYLWPTSLKVVITSPQILSVVCTVFYHSLLYPSHKPHIPIGHVKDRIHYPWAIGTNFLSATSGIRCCFSNIILWPQLKTLFYCHTYQVGAFGFLLNIISYEHGN